MAVRTISTRIAVDGEKEFKAQMSSVNSELKTLKSEMGYVDAAFKGQANSTDALTAKGALLRREVEQQQEKVKALEQAVKDSSDAYGESSKQTDGYKQSLYRAKTELSHMEDELKDTDKYLDEAAKSSDGCAQSIDGFGRATKDAGEKNKAFWDYLKANVAGELISDKLKSLANGLRTLPLDTVKAMASAFREAAGAIYDCTKAAAEYADTILTDATNTGLSTDALQEYQYMAELTDVSYETITSSHAKLIKSMGTAQKGTGDAAAAFKALGVQITQTDGTLRSNQDVFMESIDALAAMENETQRDAYAMAIFGKSAQDLNSVVAIGSDGLAAFADEAHNAGYVLDEETLSALGAVDDAQQRFSLALDAAKHSLGAEFAPAVEDILGGLTKIIDGDVDEGVDLLTSGMDKAGEVLDRLGPLAEEALGQFLDKIIESFPELVAGGVEMMGKLILGISEKFPDIAVAAVDAVAAFVEACFSGEVGEMLLEAGWNIIKGVWEGIKTAAGHVWEWATGGSSEAPSSFGSGGGSRDGSFGATAASAALAEEATTAAANRAVGALNRGSGTQNITVVTQLDGKTVAKSTSAIQNRDNRRSGGYQR